MYFFQSIDPLDQKKERIIRTIIKCLDSEASVLVDSRSQNFVVQTKMNEDELIACLNATEIQFQRRQLEKREG